MDVSITEEPTRLVAIRRATMPVMEQESFYAEAYSAVSAALAEVGIEPAGPPVGWYAGIPGDTVDVGAGFPVVGVEPGPLSHDVHVVEIPGGRALTAVHRGLYTGLPAAWAALEQLRAEAGEPARGDLTEEYLTDPSPDGDPALARTRLVRPLV